MNTISPVLRHQQQGATLIVALIVLLVMTLLAVGTQESAALQQKMSTAYQQRTVAKYAAEAALSAAENYLATTVKSTPKLAQFNGATKGLYSSYAYSGEINLASPASAEISDLANSNDWKAANSIEVSTFSGKVARLPRYIIEYAGRNKGSANKVAIDYNDPNAAADSSPHVFLITAIGYSEDERIYQVLQSSYETGHGPGNFIY